MLQRPVSKATNNSLAQPSHSVTLFFCLCRLACAFTVPLLSVNILEMVQVRCFVLWLAASTSYPLHLLHVHTHTHARTHTHTQNTHQKVYTNGPLEIIRDRPLLLVGKSQCLPFLYLMGPTILHRLALEWLSLLTSTFVQRSLPHRTNHDALSVAMRALWTSYLSSLMADAVLYPLETILVRLYCQGMPVLVDNVENGADVAFITTFYRGFFDCITGIWDSEGLWGFYRGFSALLLRYAVYGTVLFLLWRITHTHVHSVNGKTNR